ncbi:amidohydrolase family protein [Compostimonas suwonensis]|uniref:Putative TIM-barrel fold metal-dependent hydrolase n=1 Tax=Compostimonas suwonensis TaxID=1048394 RepID=A0A2M9BWS0_9MICO|nr:amidohydrolase family protein [Compostimonas suwonensis]PJJ62407.1 putative TIM-barrel fold metal-dependent hydrolase [Compostimonas suwonensis]
MIVDAQVHIWEADRPERPWIPSGASYAHRPEPITQETLTAEMDRVGVDRAYLVPPTWEGIRNDVVLRAAETEPERFRAIVRFPIDDRGSVSSLEAWARDPRVAGARLVFTRQAAVWLTDGTADWYWDVAADLGLPTMVFAPNLTRELGAVAARHPRARIAVCHVGLETSKRDDEIDEGWADALALADLPNVAVKATSLPSFTTEDYPYPLLAEKIHRLIDAYGADRVFWGSDLSRLRGDYAQLRRFFEEELDLTDDQSRLIMGEAVLGWFPWSR